MRSVMCRLRRNLKKSFEQSPYSVNVEMSHQIQLRCLPPQGVPPPQVYWLKNGAVLEPDSNIIVSSEGHLIISEARFQDTANYTCVAENIANKRLSDSALLKVIVIETPQKTCLNYYQSSVELIETILCPNALGLTLHESVKFYPWVLPHHPYPTDSRNRKLSMEMVSRTRRKKTKLSLLIKSLSAASQGWVPCHFFVHLHGTSLSPR
ncbi:hypothetical protein RUM44_005743 [Polyplax serrata]|uniref:Ig-like domain-containing protein n=1 Tax=Polyplax serrata TaxID=468196 RepID=A0ABR1AWT3_POLSC